MSRLWPWLLVILLTLTACQRGSAPVHPGPAAVPEGHLTVSGEVGSSLPWGLWDLALSVEAGSMEAAVTVLEPASRNIAAIGDTLSLEVAGFFRKGPCMDCFELRALSLDGAGNLQVDFRLRHPFRTTDARMDLDAFDPRLILIADQQTLSFPALAPILGGMDGLAELPVELEPDLVLNPDGFSPHYDWIAEAPAIVGTPRNYAGTLNPYLDFFTESDPSPTGVGTPIANRRMSMASPFDSKRMVLSQEALSRRGNQLSALLLIEVSYGQPALKSIPTGQRGSRMNPVYYLPAFNRKEAMRLAATPLAPWVEGVTGAFQNLPVEISDWQAGKVGVGPENYAQGPDYFGTSEVPYTSTLTALHLSVPALETGLKSITSFPVGDGTLSFPWSASFSIINTLNPPAGTHWGLLAAVDSYHDTLAVPGFQYDGQQSFIRDFRAFQVVRIEVAPSPVNDPPIAVLKGRAQGAGTWASTGPITVDIGQVVEFTLEDSTDDLNAWANPAAHFDLDGNPGTGANGGFETTLALISGIVSTAFPTDGSRTIRGMVRDASGQFSGIEGLEVVVNPAPPNDPPVAVLKARKLGDTIWTPAPGPLNITTGDTVQFTQEDSTDDLGLWANPAAHYDLDGNLGNGFEMTGATISTIVTRAYSSPGSITVRAKVQDNIGQDSPIVTMTVTATNPAGPPSCYNVTPIASFPIPVYEHGADTWNGKIYIGGGWSTGFSPPNNRVNKVWEYDPVTNTYAELPGTFNGFMTGQGRSGIDIVALNQRVYILGGEGNNGPFTCSNYTNPTDWFDLGTNAYSTGVQLNPNLWRCAGVAWNGRIWLPGGFREYNEFSCGSYVNSVNTTTIYNPATNTWGNLNDFGNAVPAFTTRRWAHGTVVLNNKLYILPGQGETDAGVQGYTSTVQEYDLMATAPAWVSKDSIPSHRWLYKPAVVDNRAYIIGGLSGGSGATATVYQFDPTKSPGTQWTLMTTSCGGNPLPAVVYGAATAVHNGEIYVFGGAPSLSNPVVTSYKITLQ